MVRYLLKVSFSCLAVATFVGCEYEFKDDGSGNSSSLVLLRDIPAVVSDESGPDKAEVKKPPQPPDVRPTLAPGKDVSGHAELPSKAKRLNLSELVEQEQLTVSTNVSGLNDAKLAFDESDATLSKSEGTNPFIFTFQFAKPTLIRAVKIRSTYSDYGWALEVDGSPRLVVDTVVDGEWSTIALPEGIKTGRVVVEVIRKHRDNFVHLNEVEMYE